MRSAVRGVLVGALLLALADALAARAGLHVSLLPHAHGTWLWVASRSAGIVAYVALALDAIFGLFLSTGAVDRFVPRGRSMEVHRWLSGVAIGAAAAHGLALAFDATGRFDVLDALVPLASPYRPVAVALGIAALYALVIVRESFGWRVRLGTALWKRLHQLSFAAFAMATAHGIFAGTDTARPWVRAIYVVAVAAVAALVAYRARVRRAAKAPLGAVRA